MVARASSAASLPSALDPAAARSVPAAADGETAPGALAARIAAIDAILPQTQCGKCGFGGCLPYARALASGAAPLNRCPPGGREGIARLAQLLGEPESPLDPACGTEGPLRLARIDESQCIGCTLCIQACPVDAIAGAAKRMHTVVAAECTGCELCLPPCPVDCIELVPAAAGRAWTPADAAWARARYAERDRRQARLQDDVDAHRQEQAQHKLASLQEQAAAAPADLDLARRRAIVEGALARVRARRAQRAGADGTEPAA